jgi:hypothetical protein
MRAYCLIRPETHYRRECFVAGLEAAGYEVQARLPGAAQPGDVLTIWSRYGGHEQIADRFEADGGTVIVAENAYLAPKDGSKYCALAVHAHNGRGKWSVGGSERWNALGHDLKPWRKDGRHILICLSRNFGMRGGIMAADWSGQVTKRLQALTDRPIRLRHHPRNGPEHPVFEEDLRDAWAVVIWYSSLGVRALIHGVPVLCDAPWWIAKGAAGTIEQVESPPMPDRLPHLKRMAWAQWSLEEIASGEPFRLLTEQEAVAA